MNPSETPASPTPSRIEQLKKLREFFEQWTQEDRQLSLEEADRLHVALGRNRGLRFRSLDLN